MGWNFTLQIQYAALRCGANTDARHIRVDRHEPRNAQDGASMMNFVKVGLVAMLAMAFGLGGAGAQTQTRVDASKDWSVFQAGAEGQKICWIVSKPTAWAAYRGGKKVEVNRGDIFLMVSIRPADGVVNEISFLGGYPFKPGSEVEAKIGSETYAMFTKGENAWARSPEEDAKMIDAFRRGANAKLEGVSSRGTKTVDTFSLAGFTAALESATTLCK